jgi:hypothetical protein
MRPEDHYATFSPDGGLHPYYEAMLPPSLEEFGLDLSPDPEDWDLDDAPWAPCRPTYGRTVDLEVHDMEHRPLGKVERDEYARAWERERDQLEEREAALAWEPDAYQYLLRSKPLVLCPLCQQVVKRRQFGQHYLMCREDVA